MSPGDVSFKGVNDMVSVADRESEKAILEVIHDHCPDHQILSEEAGWSPGEPGAMWIVDPLDGTTNFVHGVPHFAISIAVAVDGELAAGVVLDPIRGDLFGAARGHGTRLNGSPCQVSERQGLAGALLTTGFPFRAHPLLDPYLAIFRDVFLRCKAIRRPGAAALDLAWTAAGFFDGFFEFQLGPWDVAAGALLVAEAGGVVSDMEGGPDVVAGGDVLCAPAGVHRELLEAVGRHQEAWKAAKRG
jgi:myo-inositol-1(or 4)-monophosphatase